MLPLLKSDYKPSKCFATHGHFPAFVDPRQPPQIKKPWSALSVLKWCFKTDLIFPVELLEVVQRELGNPRLAPLGDEIKYAKVIMSLSEIIDGDFFDIYIKRGNILMLTMHNPGVDYVFELYEGILRLEIDKSTYETIGLPGQSIADGGLKHKKNRYAIELNLRLPSMLRGKKGFERIVSAFKSVKALQDNLEWLFYDCTPRCAKDDHMPIEKHHPRWFSSKAQLRNITNVQMPNLSSTAVSTSIYDHSHDDTYLSDVGEWISLIALQSSRVQAHDTVDPFYCRYGTPQSKHENNMEPGKDGRELAILSWHGFLPQSFVTGLLLRVSSAREGSFFALQAYGFRGNTVAVIKLTDQCETVPQFLCLEVPTTP